MDKSKDQNLMVLLPQFTSVKNVILKYSSPVSLNTGAKFRVCNICGIKLGIKLSGEHTRHLRTHTKAWKLYKNNVSVTLENALKNKSPILDVKKVIEMPASESSSSDSENGFDFPCVSTSGPAWSNRPPSWTVFEKKQLRKFTYYDRNIAKELREFSDIHVMSWCNEVKRGQIREIIGPKPVAHLLYVSNSKIVNKIARMLCGNQCYFDPNECFFDDAHTFEFRDLMKKSFHEKFNPSFQNIVNERNEQKVVLEYDEYNHLPETYELAEKIGFTTDVKYNKDGYLDLNYDLFCKQLWDHETPLFVLEDKKVLDVLLALLISASRLYKNKLDTIANMYAQNIPGLNRPVLALMNHGSEIHGYTSRTYDYCSTEKDETKAIRSDLYFPLSIAVVQTKVIGIVEHKKCKNFTKEDYWKFIHKDNSEELEEYNMNFTNCGPASLLNQSIVYPCNMGHWHECECRSCTILRNVNCEQHKLHMEHNIRKCFIKESTDCNKHNIDHPDNFKEGDFVIETNLLYHNGELLRGGRNYRNKETIFAGIKRDCENCRGIIQDHLKNHLVLHVHCDLCVYESKSSLNLKFWKRVCNICGKKYKSEQSKEIHLYKHDNNEEKCEYCGKIFVNQFTYQRHLSEQHRVHQHANNGPFEGMKEDDYFKYVCPICTKDFNYERNVYAHMFEVHFKHSMCRCKVCGEIITKKSNLKRHLKEQHGIINIDREVTREQLKSFCCEVCGKQFNRKSNMIDHMKIHDTNRIRYECSQCQKVFTLLRNLRHHEKLHTSYIKGYSCHLCNVEFVRKSNLRQHLATHETPKTFQCSKCGTIFEAQRTLTRHLKTHT